MKARAPFAGVLQLEHSLLRLTVRGGDDVLSRAVRQLSRAVWSTLYHGRHPLSKGRRLEAVGNLWAWQAWRRILKKPLLVELQTGAKILCPPWSAVAGAWVSIGVHEPELFLVADAVRPGDTFLDVGANIGVYAITAATRGARVIAFEPTLEARQTVEANATLNGVSGAVTTSAFALSDSDGVAYFSTGEECANHIVDDASQGVPVQMRCIDTIIYSLLPNASVDWIKIDVEGADEKVLRGALRTLRAYRPILIAEIWSGGRAIRQLLEELGYESFAYDYWERRLNRLPADFRGAGNLVAIHHDRLPDVMERLRTATPWPRPAPNPRWTESNAAS